VDCQLQGSRYIIDRLLYTVKTKGNVQPMRLVTRRVFSFLIIISLLTLFNSLACDTTDKTKFGIYLVDGGELVLSERHIEKYYWDNHTIELNEAGIEQWNSFITYAGIPKLAGTLHNSDFVLRIEGQEIYRGKFYSNVSSASYPGVVILDSLFKLDENRNTIEIDYGYGPILDSADDPRNSPEVLKFLNESGLLK